MDTMATSNLSSSIHHQLDLSDNVLYLYDLAGKTNTDDVFHTIIERPQLIFRDVKFCKHPEVMKFNICNDNDLFQKILSSNIKLDNSIIENYILPKHKEGINLQLVISECSVGNSMNMLIGIQCCSSFIIIISDDKGLDLVAVLLIQIKDSDIKVIYSDIESPSSLIKKQLSKLKSWLVSPDFEFKQSPNALVCPKEYYFTYTRLKVKYAQQIIDKWDMQTDPEKFVHEDIGIASYLICIWKARYGGRAEEYVKFIDIGCGNGLLVYILNQENFKGDGIDIHKRKIWDNAFSSSLYFQKHFEPTQYQCILNYNWLIGNHSDELTPWLPYVATMVSFECDFFVLPCCAWNFTTKYARNSSNISTYECYLEFISDVIANFDFVYDKDVMKIPSTKRTCFITKGRSYDKQIHEMQKIIAMKIVNRFSKTDTTKCVARDSEIKIKNCSKVDKGLCEEIVNYAASLILENVSRDCLVWSTGKPIHISKLVETIKTHIDFQNKLKDQHGGIKTVLKNCHQVFFIRNGMVSLRDWSNIELHPKRKRNTIRKYDKCSLTKSKLCWFYMNHPQGCNLAKDVCSYAHGEEELKSVSFSKLH